MISASQPSRKNILDIHKQGDAKNEKICQNHHNELPDYLEYYQCDKMATAQLR
jgi:hypothetical protein